MAAQGGDIDDDEAIITGTSMVAVASAGNAATGVLEHDEGQHTPEFKVWPDGHHDEESRNSAASSQQPQGHPEPADLLSNIQQQPSTTTTTGMETQYSSTIDMKDLGPASASVVVASTTWSGAQLASGSSSSVITTAPTATVGGVVARSSDPLDTVITTSAASGTTVDMNLLKWQNTQSSAMPPPGGPASVASKRGVSVDSPGQDEERLTVVEGDDSSQDSASVASASNATAAT